MSPKETFFQRIQNQQLKFRRGELDDAPFHTKIIHSIILAGTILWNEVDEDRLFYRASSLAYTTMLSMVPLLVVAGGLVMVFSQEKTGESLISLIRDNVFPVAGDTITNYLTTSIQRATEIGTGPVGGIALLITSVMLFLQIENTFNDIWKIDRSRKYYIRVLFFYAIVTLGPILLTVSILQASQLLNDIDVYTGTAILRDLTPMLIGTVIFFLMYQFLPNTHVDMRISISTSVLVLLVLKGMQFLFTLYFSKAFSTSYSVLYGALGLIPVTLIWIYASWVIILFGAEVCYCVQNKNLLTSRSILIRKQRDHWHFIGQFASIEMLAALARAFERQTWPLTAQEIAIQCEYPMKAVDGIMQKLQQNGYVTIVESEEKTGYILLKPLDTIELIDLIKLYDNSHIYPEKTPVLAQITSELRATQTQVLQKMTANDLREKTEKRVDPVEKVD